MRKTTAFLTILATSLLSYGASAQPEGAPPAAPPPEGAPPAAPAPEGAAPAEAAPAPAPVAAAGDDYISRGLTLSAGTLQVTLPVVLNLSKEAVLKPVWIPLDLRFGATNELTVFVSHTRMGMAPGFFGGGVCLGGTDRGCAKFYNNIAVGGVYSLMKNNGLELAGLLAVDVRQISDDMLLAVDVGVAVKYASAPISVTATPTLGIGVNKRSDFGNKELLSVPVQVAFQATPELALFLDTGIFGATKKFGDNYMVPVGIGGVFAVQKGLDVGAEFMLPKVISGIEGNKAMDARTLTVFAAYRTN